MNDTQPTHGNKIEAVSDPCSAASAYSCHIKLAALSELRGDPGLTYTALIQTTVLTFYVCRSHYTNKTGVVACGERARACARACVVAATCA